MDLKFEIVQTLTRLSEPNAKGWSKELNLVSWNDRPPKYDLREWSEDHSRMGKGVTFTEEEARRLCEALMVALDI